MKKYYIRLVSDIHLNFDVGMMRKSKSHTREELDCLWYPSEIDTDKDTILCIAGDLWEENKAFVRRNGADTSWLEKVASRFAHIVIVLGNHDYWGSSLCVANKKAKASIASLGLSNVTVLDKDVFVMGNIKFVGCTLWTDMDNGNPVVAFAAPQIMRNDYEYIRFGDNYEHRLKPFHILGEFIDSKEFIKTNAVRDFPEQTVVVMTHMLPSFHSIDYRHKGDTGYTNFMYYSNMEDLIHEESFVADYWFHGHTHAPRQYKIDRTEVMCNPRGYAGYENTGYNETLLLGEF